jgi:hypothetical protein
MQFQFLAAAERDLDAEFRADVAHLYALGPPAIEELLAEIGAAFTIRSEIEARLREYRRFDPEVVAAVLGGRWQ